MPVSLTSLRQRRWLASLLVVAFALRALIPAGFMPGGEGALPLQICPEGFPAALLSGTADHAAHAGHHHHQVADATNPGEPDSGAPAHDHKSWTSGHCAFGAAAGAPSLCHSSIIVVVTRTESPRPETATVLTSVDFRFRIAQPRAPPSLV
jgi:hypothetical protein